MFITYVALLYGLIIGSAINAIVWRIYVGRSWTHGRSMCPDCKHELAARDLVPVVSWMVLRGRCRYCRARIHWQYPLVELLTMGLFGLSAVLLVPKNGTEIGFLIGWLVILTLLIILAVYDTRWMILPDKIMLPAIIITLLYTGLSALNHGSWKSLWEPVLAAIIGGGGFYVIALATRGRAMGGGDIKLAFLMGLLLGLQGLLVAMFFAFDTAAIIGVILIATKRKKRRDYLPFGPFLIAGTILAFLCTRSIVGWYLHLNGL